jgi:nucleoside-diphosphate-sugar epimerase
MRVLVTGAGGFIGQHLAAELTARGHRAVPFDRPECDVRSRSQVAQAVGHCDAVVNLAARLGTPELFGSELDAAEVNILGAVNIYDAAAHYGVPVVQIGTGHRAQLNPYAITKACAEDLALSRAQWLGENITIVRAYHAYGPGQKPAPPFGPSPVAKFFPTFACRILTGLPAEISGSGEQTIDPVHVSSVARSLADAISAPTPGSVVEAGNGKGFSVAQVAAGIAAAAGVNLAVSYTAGRLGEPEDAVVVASDPACDDVWPYQVTQTVDWYRQWLARWSP